jgi:hypothetical protein
VDGIWPLAARQDGVITRAQAAAVGMARHEVDSLCRAGRWARLARGVYLVDGSRLPTRRALIRAVLLSLGPGAVAVLDTAAELHGIAGLPPSETVHVSLPGDATRATRATLRRNPHVQVHQLAVPEGRLTVVADLAVTDPLQTVADLILRADRFTAVSILDSVLNRELIRPDELAAIPSLLHGRRGAVAARRHVAEADGRSESPLETRVRLRCVDGRVGPDTLQHVVRDEAGGIVGVGDLAWLGARLIGDADGGDPQTSPGGVLQDRRRQNRLASAGWQVVRFTWRDTLTPTYIPTVVRAALGR